jgi:hypothetical protein
VVAHSEPASAAGEAGAGTTGTRGRHRGPLRHPFDAECDEARHLAAELSALVTGEHAEDVDYERAAAPLRKRMAYLRKRGGAADGSGK